MKSDKITLFDRQKALHDINQLEKDTVSVISNLRDFGFDVNGVAMMLNIQRLKQIAKTQTHKKQLTK